MTLEAKRSTICQPTFNLKKEAINLSQKINIVLQKCNRSLWNVVVWKLKKKKHSYKCDPHYIGILSWPFAGAAWWSLWQEACSQQVDWCRLRCSPSAPRSFLQASQAPAAGLVCLSRKGSTWSRSPPSLSCQKYHSPVFAPLVGWSESPRPSCLFGWPLQERGSSRNSLWSRRSCKRPLALQWWVSPLLDAHSQSGGTLGRTQSVGRTLHLHPDSALGSSTWLRPGVSLGISATYLLYQFDFTGILGQLMSPISLIKVISFIFLAKSHNISMSARTARTHTQSRWWVWLKTRSGFTSSIALQQPCLLARVDTMKKAEY